MLTIDTARADLERLRRLSRDFSEELTRARVELARAKLVVVAANRLLGHDPMRCGKCGCDTPASGVRRNRT
jgi:hypothetical protein